MTTKIDGTAGVVFPDATQQATAADAGPAFSANRSTIQYAAGSNAGFAVLFNNETFDTASAYNPSTGIFKPNVAGYYQLNAVVNLNGDGALTQSNLAILKNDVDVASSQSQDNNGTYETHSISCLVYLNGTTDTVYVAANIIGIVPLYVFATAGVLATFSGFLARRAAP